jgi:hypothetical protein
VADLLEIQQLLYRYCYAHDSRNEEMLRSCFAKDAELLGAKGRDNIVATFTNGYKQLTSRRRHVLTNSFLVQDGEDEAVVQSYITLYLIDGEHLSLHLIGVYRDHVIKEDGEWKILSREAEMDVPYTPGDVKPGDVKPVMDAPAKS